jgi:hypothetical protein
MDNSVKPLRLLGRGPSGTENAMSTPFIAFIQSDRALP